MKKKYRIINTIPMEENATAVHPVYIVQVRAWWGAWVNVKTFYDPWDSDFAQLEAEELLDKLNE